MVLAQEYAHDQDVYLDSVALNLHDFYTGLERAFEQIATNVDETMPSGRNWHRDLLRQMAEECSTVRPAVLSSYTRDLLEEYLRFRHLVRNIYAFEFDPVRLGRLVEELDQVYELISREMEAFAFFLDEVIQ